MRWVLMAGAFLFVLAVRGSGEQRAGGRTAARLRPAAGRQPRLARASRRQCAIAPRLRSPRSPGPDDAAFVRGLSRWGTRGLLLRSSHRAEFEPPRS
jgi:hypothetical protein